MKLISTTDFVLEQSKLTGYDISDYDWIIRIVNYAKFLKQPLKLEMFVPCVNEEPFNYSKHGNAEQYEKAKEKVLFEGCSSMQKGENTIVIFNDSAIWLTWTNRIIEDLIQYNLTLTENALKQIGL